MTKIGYQASHEQSFPKQLLEYSKQAESHGFECVLSSDHVHPWSSIQGQSGFAWSWLGAALEATNLDCGVVSVPGYRYHPVILAQAVATLDQMYPGRFFLTLGSGEALNEHITGTKWPVKPNRHQILLESVQVMRRLWQGEEVTFKGEITVEEAQLFTLPTERPQVIGAALTPETAAWLGTWADGLITVCQPMDKLKKVLSSFKKNGGEGKPILLQAQLSYAKTYKQALDEAHQQWGPALLPSEVLSQLRTPAEFAALGHQVSKEKVKEMIFISDDHEEVGQWIKKLLSLNFERIILHNVNRDQTRFIDEIGKRVLSKL